MKTLINKSFLFILGLLLFTSLEALGNAITPSIFDRLYQDEILAVSIKTNLTNLIEHKKADEYQAGKFSYKNKDGQVFENTIKVKARGKYRRRVCDFPPIKIKFNKDELKSVGLSKHNDLKLVTHCLENKLEGNANVFKEYLAYKMYNIVSPNSFRVQLVKITYIDEENGKKTKRYGFLIEDTDEMAERLGGEECDDCHGLKKEDLDSRTYNQMAAFEYLIGNEDWNLKMLRNIKIVAKSDGTFIPVPYDFDFSGFVDASYALPSAEYNHTQLSQREWLADCVSKPELFQIKMNFDHCENKFHRLIQDFKLLTDEDKLKARNYLDSFYQEELVKIISCFAEHSTILEGNSK